MQLKVFLSISVEIESGRNKTGWIKNLIDLTPVVEKYYTTRAAIERGADRLRGVVDSALGFDRCVWGMG